ncbi:hypothetical protein EAH73_08205 [Hymenobacter nivis]|uniref:Uncharacterized protein n=1 Tax=Hymenobacter nivis TaxID=1850093 RepID=A0A502GWX3_9BACT|nr:hypothetical protein EAH73_08205 [Hymenobacter nivis]
MVVLGQFQEEVFAVLTRLWRAPGALLVGGPGAPTAGAAGLSQHSLPASVTYHLLYAGASAGALHVLLRGRGTRWVVAGFGVALVLGVGLLAAGRAGHWPGATEQGHRLLGLASSPLALLAGYALALLGQPGAPPSEA